MSKTPVSILNELCIAMGTTPSFQLMRVEGSPHAPKFSYRVEASFYFAEGEGTSKQLAKQNAAQALLDVLKIRENETAPYSNELLRQMEQVTRPQDDRIGINAVGELNSYCELKNLPPAEYTEISAEGPPHAKIFTFRCSVSHLKKNAIGRTKKEAKHKAAFSVLTELKKLSGEQVLAVAKPNDERENERIAGEKRKQDEKMVEEYFKISKTAHLRTTARCTFIAYSYRAYGNLVEKSPTLYKLVHGAHELLKIPLETLTGIAQDVGLDVHQDSFPCAKDSVTFVRVEFNPVLCRCGRNGNDAALSCLEALLEFINSSRSHNELCNS